MAIDRNHSENIRSLDPTELWPFHIASHPTWETFKGHSNRCLGEGYNEF